MAKLVSKTYGDALFNLAVEEDCMDTLAQEVQAVAEIFKENADLAAVFRNPDVGKDEKLELTERIFKERISDYLVGFLRILVTKGRVEEMGSIFEYFLSRVKEYKKIGVATVTSPTELSGEWKSKIEKKLLDTTGYETMEMSYQVDPKLIGGLVIRIKDTVVDSSILNKLTDMQRKLMKTSLENN